MLSMDFRFCPKQKPFELTVTIPATFRSVCLLDCDEAGKYTLRMTLVSDENEFVDDSHSVYSIDEIAGI